MTIELGNRLAELRKQHGLSQEELADQLGVSRQAISKWERGEASPDTDNLIELARIYNISLDELLGLKGSDEDKEKFGADGIHIDSTGIHVTDEDGSEVHVTNKGVDIVDESGERKHVDVKIKTDKKHRVTALVSLIVTFSAVIAYILLGTLLGLWTQAWTLFLLIPVVPSACEAFILKNANVFAYPVFIAFVYLTLCSWVLPAFNAPAMWHPLWVLFLTIPVYYGVCNFIKVKD